MLINTKIKPRAIRMTYTRRADEPGASTSTGESKKIAIRLLLNLKRRLAMAMPIGTVINTLSIPNRNRQRVGVTSSENMKKPGRRITAKYK